ncbi:MAG: hypothetical protein KDA33_04910 [Phycisphaerales bacterium]|nr:hypothetical protein [Phycisphaerales bacterium]
MNTHKRTIAIIISSFAGALFLATSNAMAVNADRVIAYDLFEDYSDPQSDVIFTVYLDLGEQTRDVDAVGWKVKAAYFEMPRPNDDPIVWKVTAPYLTTSDGLYWVEHADLNAPVDAEFDQPPEMSGTAPVFSGQYFSSLVFYFMGLDPDHFPDEANIKYTFTQEGEGEPIATKPQDIGEIKTGPHLPGTMAGSANNEPKTAESTSGFNTLLRILDHAVAVIQAPSDACDDNWMRLDPLAILSSRRAS